MGKMIKIGGASGYWGESALATPQLLTESELDYLVYDYLAEITMSIMARAKAKDAKRGYATDFIDLVLKPHLNAIANKGVKIISNAGGVNPEACAKAARELIKKQGLALKVAVITGDDRMDTLGDGHATDMFSGAPMPAKETIASANLYLGAFPIAKALSEGADIIITGRCVDSAVTLGACIHEFGWHNQDWDKLASGSLAGHILECGPQATGGNFTDWKKAGDIANIGYPIAAIHADGSFIVTKPKNTEGIVNVGTVSEQMLYEIGDPQNYILPDVVCDFSNVQIEEIAPNTVRVSPAKGRPATNSYKTCLTYHDGFRAGTYLSLYGEQATLKAESLSAAIFKRAEQKLSQLNLEPFTEISQEIIGGGSQIGTRIEANEVVLKIAAKHKDAKAIGLFLKEVAGMGLATPPGLSGFTGAGRARPSPVVRLFSYLTQKSDVEITIEVAGKSFQYRDKVYSNPDKANIISPPSPVMDSSHLVTLKSLAWARSGDKGDKANIGIIARKAEYLPYIWHAMTTDFISNSYAHFMSETSKIERFYLPGANAMNILISAVLGGGGAASLRNDAQAKGYSQILLSKQIAVSPAIAETFKARI